MVLTNAERSAQQREQMTTPKCIKYFAILAVIFEVSVIIACIIVFILNFNTECQIPFKTFIFVYAILLSAQTAFFVFKNKNCFYATDEVPEINEDEKITKYSGFLDMFLLLWYLVGLHWMQEFKSLGLENTILYYTASSIVIIGIFKVVFPLLALALLILLVQMLNPEVPTVVYNEKTELFGHDPKCSICFENYSFGDELKQLPCNHHFHSQCINKWFLIDEMCPLCMESLNPFIRMIYSQPESVLRQNEINR